MARVYIESYGCSLNLSEGEAMAGLLLERGHVPVDSPAEADCLVVNMCSVKTPTERKIVRRVRELAGAGKPLIVAGCIPPDGERTFAAISPQISLVGTHQLHRIADGVEAALAGKRVAFLERAERVKLGLPKVRRSQVIGIVPISSGCDLACAYCATRLIKGRLFSYPQQDILKEAERLTTEGCRELWLTSQDNAAYGSERAGRQGRSSLPDLLEAIAALPDDFRVRVGMMNPSSALAVLDRLLDAFASEKVFKFFHVPVQSGSDSVLAGMGRSYTVAEFRAIARVIRERFPESTLSTDIICGFPGETDAEFKETLSLLRDVKPDVLNISRFWPRPGTAAALLPDQVHGSITKERSTAVAALFKRISEERCAGWRGWEGQALVDEPGTRPGTAVARNAAYRPIAVSCGSCDEKVLLGKTVRVRVIGAGPHYLLGEIVRADTGRL